MESMRLNESWCKRKIMFTGKCCRDVRGVYLIQTHSTHWHFLKDKGHRSLLDTCPKVPLIHTESSTPCFASLYRSRSSLACEAHRRKGVNDWALMPHWSEGRWSELWGWPSSLGNKARFCSGSPQLWQGLRPGRYPQMASCTRNKSAFPDSATPTHLPEPVTQGEGGRSTDWTQSFSALSLLSEKQSVFW